MTAIHVDVTAEDIAACPLVPDTGDGWRIDTPSGRDPIELAIARAVGVAVECDGGDTVEGPELATIGARGEAARTTLIVALPFEERDWIEAFFKGLPVEQFSFDIELDDWLVALIARSATTLEQADAVIATDAERHHEQLLHGEATS